MSNSLAGMKVIHRLGLRQSNLIPITITMHSVNSKNIKIIKATVLRISGKDEHGQLIETRHMTCVTDTSDKLFINRENCIALAIIPHGCLQLVGKVKYNMMHQLQHYKRVTPMF